MKKIVLFYILIVMFSGCKTLKNTTSGTESSGLTTESVLKYYKENLFQAQTLSAKLKTSVQNDNGKQSFTIKLRLEKDKAIWMSASYFGITMAKVFITPDRIQYYEKLNQTYYSGDYEWVEQHMGFNFEFEQLQNIILGQAFNSFDGNQSSSQFIDDQLVVKYEPYIKDIFVFFTLNTQFFKLAAQEVFNEKNQIVINYPDYLEIDNELIPSEINIKLTDIKQQKISKASMIFSDVILNETLTFPFEIPDGYTTIKN